MLYLKNLSGKLLVICGGFLEIKLVSMRDWSKKITSFLEMILIINIHDKTQCFDPVSALINAKLV